MSPGAEVKKLEAILEEMTKDDPVVALIRMIPGAGLVPWVQNSAERERHGKIAKRGPNELRTALVQVVLGMVRNKRQTGTYRIMECYDRLNRAKGSGRSFIATTRILSEIIWHILEGNQPFDETRMKNPEIRRKAMEMQAAALEVA